MAQAIDYTTIVAGAGTALGAAIAAGLAAWANRKGKAAGEAAQPPQPAMSSPGWDRLLLEALNRVCSALDVGNGILDEIKDDATRAGERAERSIDALRKAVERVEEAVKSAASR